MGIDYSNYPPFLFGYDDDTGWVMDSDIYAHEDFFKSEPSSYGSFESKALKKAMAESHIEDKSAHGYSVCY